jgi:hypothetical protein
MIPEKIIESIPTEALLRDAESAGTQSPEERGYNISKTLQRGALTCLAATIPMFVLKNHEHQMSYPIYNQGVEQSIEKPRSPLPISKPKMDMSTLQDAVSGLGFILDPPNPEPPQSPLPARTAYAFDAPMEGMPISGAHSSPSWS